MRKIVLFCIMLFVSLCAFSQERTFYFARHGQRGDLRYQIAFRNCTEDRLMPNGIAQAEALGDYLKKIGFDGTVLVSPYYRTLETAAVACTRFGAEKMTVEPACQEVTGLKNASQPVRTTKKCLTKKEIKQNFPGAVIPKKMRFPWRLENERESKADERISLFIDSLISDTSGDVLVVCHGGIMNSVVREMNRRGADFPRQKNYNCCLYSFTFDVQTDTVVRWADETLNFMPDELYTDNLAAVYR